MGKPAARMGDTSAHGGTITLGNPTLMVGKMPASTLGDMHVCPMCTGPVPHVGGPITLGSMGVLLGKKPGARISDISVCVGPPSMPVVGCFTVLIGEAGSGSQAGSAAAAAAAQAAKAAGPKGIEAFPLAEPPAATEIHDIQIEFTDSAGKPLSGVVYHIKDPDSKEIIGASTSDGKAYHGGYAQKGKYELTVKTLADLKWGKSESGMKDPITFSAKADSFEDGVAAAVMIFEECGGQRRLLETLDLKVSGEKISGEWKWKRSYLPPEGAGPRPDTPVYVFQIVAGGLVGVSGPLKLKDTLTVKVTDPEGTAKKQLDYEIALPNGQMKVGALDDSGKVSVADLAPGNYKVKLLHLKGKSETEPEAEPQPEPRADYAGFGEPDEEGEAEEQPESQSEDQPEAKDEIPHEKQAEPKQKATTTPAPDGGAEPQVTLMGFGDLKMVELEAELKASSKSGKVLKRGDRGPIVEELNIRLAGFGGLLPKSEFDSETERCVKLFQTDWMKVASPTGTVDLATAKAIDEFSSKHVIPFVSLKCDCGKCGGFGKSQFKGEYHGAARTESKHKYEYPGIHRSLLWGFKGALFYLGKEGLKLRKVSCGYRCWVNNDKHKRKSTNHMGKALDFTVDLQAKAGGKPECDKARSIIVSKLGGQVRWAAKNKFSLEPGESSNPKEFVSPTWVHMDVREFDSKYLTDGMFTKTLDGVNGKAMASLFEEWEKSA